MEAKTHKQIYKPGFIWLAIIAFWGLLALFNTSQSLLSAYANNRPVRWASTLIWQIGWLVWAGLTPLVIGLAKKYKIDKTLLRKSVLTHLGLAVTICSLHFVLEASLNYTTSYFFNPHPLKSQWFVGLIAYKFHVHLFAYFAIVGIVQAIGYFGQSQKFALEKSALELKTNQLESQLVQAQLQSLKMQLQPHFLFNTHHAVIALMLKQENQQAIEMLTKLSNLLRLTLDQGKQQVISLAEETGFVQLYLDIQQIRYQHRLQIHMNVPDKLQQAQVPNMLLQPLVENALKHGIEPHSQSGILDINTSLVEAGTMLMLTIQDDGQGIDFDNFKEGIGLQNTRQRLQQLYPNKFDIQLSNMPQGGALVEVTIPYQPMAITRSVQQPLQTP